MFRLRDHDTTKEVAVRVTEALDPAVTSPGVVRTVAITWNDEPETHHIVHRIDPDGTMHLSLPTIDADVSDDDYNDWRSQPEPLD